MMDRKTMEKAAGLLNTLQNLLQAGYRETMVPLRKEEYEEWYRVIAPREKLTCYMGYWEQADVESEPVYKFCKVTACPDGWDWKTGVKTLGNIVVVESASGDSDMRYAKSLEAWDDGIQLYLDSESSGYYKVDSYDKIRSHHYKKNMN